jgi:hypothetical protein
MTPQLDIACGPLVFEDGQFDIELIDRRRNRIVARREHEELRGGPDVQIREYAPGAVAARIERRDLADTSPASREIKQERRPT